MSAVPESFRCCAPGKVEVEMQRIENVAAGRERVVWYGLSRAASYVFHPFLVPVWIMIVLLGAAVFPFYMSAGVRRYIVMVVAIDTLAIPAMGIVLMRLLGIIRDYSLSTRHDRILPLAVVAVCYGVCGWLLDGAPVLFLMRRMMFAAMACTLFALAVTTRWQISLHMTAWGGATGIVLLLLVAGYDVVWILCGAIAVSGIVASARLRLGKHTPAQVGVGFAGGLLIASAVMLLWP